VRTPVTARLNIPYTVARAILTGGLDPDTFTDAALSDEETLALAARVTVSTAERYGAASTGARSCVVTVRLRDGTTLTTEVVHSRWDRHLPPSDAELEAKFDGLARRALGPDEVVRLKSAIWGLDELGSIAALTDILAQARERVA
jgi:2-methylcitrate dehydratase PrpD